MVGKEIFTTSNNTVLLCRISGRRHMITYKRVLLKKTLMTILYSVGCYIKRVETSPKSLNVPHHKITKI